MGTGTLGYDWLKANRQADLAPTRGTDLASTPNSDPSTVCGRSLDSSVSAGGLEGVPINDGSVTTGNLLPNPNPAQPPVLTTGPAAPTYPNGVNSGAYDALFAWSFVQPLNIARWCIGVQLYFIKAGTTFSKGAAGDGGIVDFLGSGNYSKLISGLVAGTAYDVYAAYIDGQNKTSPAVLLQTTAANPIVLPPTGNASIPSGFSVSASPSTPAYEAGNSGSSTVNSTLTLSVTLGTGSLPVLSWLDHIDVMYAIQGSGNIAVGQTIPASGYSTSLLVTVPGLGAGQAYDVSLRFVAANPQSTYQTGVIFTTTPQYLDAEGMTGVPAGTTFTCPTTISSYGAPNAGSYSANCSTTITITGIVGVPIRLWAKSVDIYTSTDGANWSRNTTIPINQTGTQTSPFTVTYTIDGLGAGQAYYIAAQLRAVNDTVTTLNGTGAITVAQRAGTTALGQLPSTAPSLTANNTPTWSVYKGLMGQATLTFTENDFGLVSGAASNAAIDKIIVYVRDDGGNLIDTYPIDPVNITASTSTTASYSQKIALPSGGSYQCGLYYQDASGKHTSSTEPAAWAIADPNGDILGTGGGPGTGALKHNRQSVGVTTLINLDGSHNATDFTGMVEASPTGAKGGYRSTQGNSVCWEKTGVSTNLSTGPAVFKKTGYCTAWEFSIFILADANTANTDPSNAYMIRVNPGSPNTLQVFKRSSGSLTNIGQVNCSDPTNALDHTLSVVASYDGTTVTIVATFDGDQVIATDSSSPRTSGFYGIRNSGGTTYVHAFSVETNQVSAANISVSELSGPPGANKVKQLNDGIRTRTAANVAAVVDGSGNVPNTAAFKANVLNSIANLLSNITVQSYSASSGSLVLWVTSTVTTSQSPGGTGYPDWECPDGSGGIFPGHTNGYSTLNGTSSSSPGQYWNGSSLTSMSWSSLGTTTYMILGYDIVNDRYTILYGPSSSAPNDAQIASAAGDGTILICLISASSGTGIPTAGGGGHTFNGGGGRPQK